MMNQVITLNMKNLNLICFKFYSVMNLSQIQQNIYLPLLEF